MPITMRNQSFQKIIGESYFNLKLYSEAIHLESYKGKGKITNTDLYQLGYAYFKEKNSQKHKSI